MTAARPWPVSFLLALVSVCLPVGAYQAGAAPLLVQLSLLLVQRARHVPRLIAAVAR